MVSPDFHEPIEKDFHFFYHNIPSHYNSEGFRKEQYVIGIDAGLERTADLGGNVSGIKSFLLKFSILTSMLLGLPLIGVFLAGNPISRYLDFPPKTQYVLHAPFSWIAFSAFGLCILAVLVPFIVKALRVEPNHGDVISSHKAFPWWGWLGVLTGVIFWIAAWSRFPWFAELQPFTFTPLWLSFILVINATSYCQSGRCLMTERPGFFLLLFPVSAVFWWFFEYLNRFVQNWYYSIPDFSSQEYFWYATLPFSTVLPAVLSMRQWLFSTRWVHKRYGNFSAFTLLHPGLIATGVLVISAIGLSGIGVWPNYLFPLLWVSPLLIILCLQTLLGERTIIDEMRAGDWRIAVSSALAALICGVFWEMWNYFSLAKWEYSIPFVHRFQIFEMPILGYAGYLPFGLECTVVGGMLERMLKK